MSLAPLAGLRFLDDAELQQLVDLRADGCLIQQNGRRLRGSSQWVDLCGQGPDRCREYANVFSAKAPQLFLKLWRTRECNHGNDFIWHFGVPTLGTHFEWICPPFDVIVVRDGIQ